MTEVAHGERTFGVGLPQGSDEAYERLGVRAYGSSRTADAHRAEATLVAHRGGKRYGGAAEDRISNGAYCPRDSVVKGDVIDIGDDQSVHEFPSFTADLHALAGRLKARRVDVVRHFLASRKTHVITTCERHVLVAEQQRCGDLQHQRMLFFERMEVVHARCIARRKVLDTHADAHAAQLESRRQVSPRVLVSTFHSASWTFAGICDLAFPR